MTRRHDRYRHAARRRLAATAAVLLTAVACDIPQDPNDSLETARGDVLLVGVTEAPPWVIRSGDDALGVEPALIRRFARSIDAEPRWVWGTTEENLTALEHYELHVAVGAFTRASPWAKRLGATPPYHTVPEVVGVPPGTAPPVDDDALDGRRVAVVVRGRLPHLLREEGALPVPVERLDSAASEGLWIAAPEWELERLGYTASQIVLQRHRHVMLAPPGENGFLYALENTLHGADVEALLAEAASLPRPQ